MSAASGLSITQTATMSRLKTPLSASGLTDRGLRHMQAAIDRQGLPFIAYMGSSASNNPPPPARACGPATRSPRPCPSGT